MLGYIFYTYHNMNWLPGASKLETFNSSSGKHLTPQLISLEILLMAHKYVP